MVYDIVSFDLDGTLVDTAAEIAEAVNLALGVHGVARRPTAEITHLIGDGSRQLMLKLLARLYLEQPALAEAVRAEAVLERFEHELNATIGSMCAPYAGTHEALARMREAGVRLACVTNKELRHARRVLQATRLDGLFELVVGGDSLPHRKPHASVLGHVVARLDGDSRRAAHVGDSSTDMDAARNAGVAAWAVPYGYNAGVPIADSRPQRIFPGLVQVADFVLAGRLAAAAAPSSVRK
ncbi:HAD-IA family hydrolase [Variovorax sp. J22R24]|uniref:HAD-IA family hydrolase n=1 Tax=Variovorax gracilis TaxID=3053502 RepID=UPI0025777DDE|nr:HAD-IA family hydrolase [Variovorax sp. J22R24]MDM0108168.1 HAD-IA family hydrolase [Variovorax sp. J22R24]